ncbi:MAG: aspartate kinase [Firmicutes bacterium]|nr:aspartate kinase [Bacillota bacterium]
MHKVVKFGGSSLSNSSQWIKVKNIIEADETRKIVVVSALGRDFEHATKITDLLLLLATHLELGIDHNALFQDIAKRHLEIKTELNLSNKIDVELAKIEKELNKNISRDYLISRGEYLSAFMMSEYLGYYFLDATKSIFVDYSGIVDYEKTSKAVNHVLEKHDKIVVPGFYASTASSKVKLFSRGGSDITGSILAKALKADIYENWTDVDGLAVSDPKLIENVDLIKQITYSELRELSYRGASIIHEETIIPLLEDNIPLQIKNTNNPSAIGTIISSSVDALKNSKYITAIAGKKDYASFNIVKDSISSKIQVLTDVLKVFKKHNVNIENIPSGIDSFSVIVEGNQIIHSSFEMMNEIQNVTGVQEVSIEDKIALIAVVGKNMANIPGVAGKLFTTLGNNHVNIKIIAQASAELSIIIGVNNEDYNHAVNIIYSEFYLKNKE